MGESQTITMDKQEVETRTMSMLRPCRQSQNLDFEGNFTHRRDLGSLWIVKKKKKTQRQWT